MHEKNIHAMVYSEDLECLITGGEDCMIQLYYLNQVVPTYNDVPLPTCFKDHEVLCCWRATATVSID
ncbi:hypothetical protein FOA52_006100 [Chlamydomonas sp. UWO 241]|nr:hypothetical protein FOA52_006100 [Chlamydomonas sp. UWO 241]